MNALARLTVPAFLLTGCFLQNGYTFKEGACEEELHLFPEDIPEEEIAAVKELFVEELERTHMYRLDPENRIVIGHFTQESLETTDPADLLMAVLEVPAVLSFGADLRKSACRAPGTEADGVYTAQVDVYYDLCTMTCSIEKFAFDAQIDMETGELSLVGVKPTAVERARE